MSQNYYSIVQCSFGEEDSYICVLPSSWVVINGWNKGVSDKLTKLEGGDMCYWPAKAAGYRLLEKAKRNPNVGIDANLLIAYRCKLKRTGFQTYNDACKEQKQMEMDSDTDEVVPKKRSKVDSNAADMFEKILHQSQAAKPRKMFAQSGSVKIDDVVSASDERNVDSCSSDSEAAEQNRNTLRQTMMSLSSISQLRSPLRSLPDPEPELTSSDAQNGNSSLNERLKNLENQVNRCFILLSQINAKLDVIGSRNHQEKLGGEEIIDERKSEFEPVKNLVELDAIEEKCKNDCFVESVVRSMGKVHGKHRFTGAGQTVCLQLIDYFVDRRFLREVSWTGVSKTKDSNGKLKQKVAFSKYSKFINLFFQTVLNADELFSLEACHKFLKQCIRNSKQRLEDIKQMRTSVSRKRGRKIVRKEGDLDDEHDDHKDSDDTEGFNDNSAQQPSDLIDSQGMFVEVLEETYLKSESLL